MVITLRTADPSLTLGEPIPKDQVPDPTSELGEGTLRTADAVSDVLLPLDGEGDAALRRLGRFMLDDSGTDGITPAGTGDEAPPVDLDQAVTHVEPDAKPGTGAGGTGTENTSNNRPNTTPLGKQTGVGGAVPQAGGKEG